ncbi:MULTISPECIES: bifunctional adenosylcobinamide kinase/adenosylcobinamide-phosphate guanylyltransferase [Streptomycetaceae]|uniref:Adenosylcobinamide kinase n=1 Tax=Streptantibioticus cattleyicolor (strain ATCC 35852 / DSM 46488 / JCM 4925 / NBRC 14057 / NRRL 8057) TaxID=1003195 RepID=F8K0Z6_STREN|nr:MULTISPECIES: bifunctional adenosylcobinamide kinase/adenosylcobinamide-phosphate guanylyltransferase [Streptomycetaceae]AEW93668.1 adenosylcobinamide kinase/adenosylcobinamide phosphate guanylyltransferase [Streptantibioticus cattleyicolor NRRL 8057 = DSM 46488]MYS58370.1 adenosylcobinamide kinase/adenosylcobinamide phosphate guanyltransferase [Streptomyces sp. SID5468]CCB74018.1 putative adenosylcobinamide kinase/adenosylcobinamide phosphate guanylyltransferase [Streptantibioticus cattleyic
MEITLLGTGGPRGLPVPGCPCAVCSAAVASAARAPVSLLVDGTLLLDLTPGPALAAARAGRTLSGVRQVLLTHPQAGPPVDLPPGLPAPGRVPEGERLTSLTGHRVLAVPVDAPGTGYEVTGPAGDRLLYLPPGCGPAGLSSDGDPAPYDMVLLDVVGRPDALARLRAAGAVGATTDVIAVHLGHDAPPEPELHRRLGAAGARAVPDGRTLTVGEYEAVPDVPRRTLVLGGARSGKSAEAERRLSAFPGVVYVATGGTRDGDAEWAARVRLHRERRPATWRTVETCDLLPLLAEDGPPLLVDCLALWLTHVMDAAGAWQDAPGADREIDHRTAELAAAWRATRRTVVAVSNEVGSGVVPATASGRRFRDALGRLNTAVAAESEHVLLVVSGLALRLR